VLSKDKFGIPVLLKGYFRHAFDVLEALVAVGGLALATKFEPRDRHTLACFAARDGRTELLARLHRQVR
jgi:hypothetical protein